MAEKTHDYSHYTMGCRCVVCRAAKAAYMREKRVAARLKRDAAAAAGEVYIAPNITHGTAGYRDAACRCHACFKANKTAAVRWRRAKQAVS